MNTTLLSNEIVGRNILVVWVNGGEKLEGWFNELKKTHKGNVQLEQIDRLKLGKIITFLP